MWKCDGKNHQFTGTEEEVDKHINEQFLHFSKEELSNAKCTGRTEVQIWVQYGTQHVWTGGSPLHEADKWIFQPWPASPVLQGSESETALQIEMARQVEEATDLSKDFPLGNEDRRYESRTIVVKRTVTYGEWTATA
jgi:hypothetical protein